MSGPLVVRSSAEEMAATSQTTDRSVGVTPDDDTGPRPRTGSRFRHRLMVADAAAILVGVAISFLVQTAVRPVPRFVVIDHIALVLATAPAFVFGASVNRLYQARANERPVQEATNIARAVGVWVAVLVTVAFGIQFDNLSRLWVFVLALATASALVVERRVARRVFSNLRANGRMTRRIVIVGTDAHAIGLMHTYQRNPALGYAVVGFVGPDDLGDRGGVRVLGPIDELLNVLQDHDANGVLVSLASVPQDDVNALTRRLTDAGYHVALSSSLRDIDITRLRPQELDGRTMIYVEPVIRHGWRVLAKRVFDLTMATIISVLTLPLLVAAMIAIKLDSRGPGLYRQTRVGRDGCAFTMTKLRTMVVDADARKADLLDQNEADGPLFKMTDDPRITRVGRVLRKLSIDELPQLWSVFSGTMSMVGPRPALPDEVAQWDDSLRERLRVPPGLTGMWQVSGRSGSSFEQYRRLDLYYVDNWSLTHDIRICARTVGVVLTGRGAA